ncbi:MAG TPA: toluene-4-monooxygenase system B family protein [Polyangiaceae bacterium]|nr:toluene-4-monooxygenase system B family protein [Polyangiaceae bacterium]
MLVPLHGFVQGDTVGLLVLVHDTDTIAQLARVLADAAAVRVRPSPVARVYRGGKELEPSLTVAGAGLSALERVDLVPEWPSPTDHPPGGGVE